MKAIKGNKEYSIDEKQKKFYQDAGFDIKDDNGNVIAYGRGKTVPYGDYAALKEENKALKARVKELEAAAQAEKEPETKAGKK
ncbi:hypothetical protein [[Clostridium] symbiosum]|uniref:hypothetical protein n=1 Tax=Clostridium symbiosum TaxID=1512 RepID=UPI001896B1C5|nr:hypothetical protein [[Clostridium] symbiosum]